MAALKAEGVKVVEVDGWRTRNRNHKGAWGPVNGVMIHHTVTSGTKASVDLCRDGHATLPGPLCLGVIAKDGTVHLVGNGRTNHAGSGDDDVLKAVIAVRTSRSGPRRPAVGGVVSVDPASGREHPKPTSKSDSYAVVSPGAKGVDTVIDDPDPAYDDCADKDHTGALAAMQGKNIGDLLNARAVSWGWFQGGFLPSTAWDGPSGDYAKCGATTHTNVGGAAVEDYSPHHNPFAYY